MPFWDVFNSTKLDKSNPNPTAKPKGNSPTALLVSTLVLGGPVTDWRRAVQEGFAESRKVLNANDALQKLLDNPPDKAELLEELLWHLPCDYGNQRYYLAYTLVGDMAIAPLLEAFNSKYENQQMNVIHTLGTLRASAAIERIEQYLAHREEDFRIAAVQALGRIGHPQAYAILKNLKNLRVPKAIYENALSEVDIPVAFERIKRLVNEEKQKLAEAESKNNRNAMMVATARLKELMPQFEHLQALYEKNWSK